MIRKADSDDEDFGIEDIDMAFQELRRGIKGLGLNEGVTSQLLGIVDLRRMYELSLLRERKARDKRNADSRKRYHRPSGNA